MHNTYDTKRRKEYVGLLLLLTGVVGLFFAWYQNKGYADITRTFSPYTFFTSTWVNYKERFINEDGRVIDDSQNNITTSEGQSYAMLRSVWVDDKATFESVWKFTKETMQRENGLFGWKWGEKEGGEYGFLEPGGSNSASDADSDIALALIFASRRWGDESYNSEALKVLEGLWEENTALFNDKRYLLAGSWANQPEELVLNPSYFAPYAWREFHSVDKDHNWESLIDPAYELLNSVSEQPLDEERSVGLPPDWVAIGKVSGEVQKPKDPGLSTRYGFDAIRVPWRVFLDYQWNDEQRAKDYLLSNFDFLKDEYVTKGKLGAVYSHAGEQVEDFESPAMYAMNLTYFMLEDPSLAADLYQNKIINLYSNGINSFDPNLNYYEQNLLWFGAATYNEQLIKL